MRALDRCRSYYLWSSISTQSGLSGDGSQGSPVTTLYPLKCLTRRHTSPVLEVHVRRHASVGREIADTL